jgi:hypothetical protein
LIPYFNIGSIRNLPNPYCSATYWINVMCYEKQTQGQFLLIPYYKIGSIRNLPESYCSSNYWIKISVIKLQLGSPCAASNHALCRMAKIPHFYLQKRRFGQQKCHYRAILLVCNLSEMLAYFSCIITPPEGNSIQLLQTSPRRRHPEPVKILNKVVNRRRKPKAGVPVNPLHDARLIINVNKSKLDWNVKYEYFKSVSEKIPA